MDKEKFVNRREFLKYNISHSRKLLGLSQEELAELCDVSTDTIRGWENNRSTPNENNLKRLSFALNVDLIKGYQDLVQYKYIMALVPTLKTLGYEIFVGFVGNSTDIISTFTTDNALYDYYIAYSKSLDAIVRFYNDNKDDYDYEAMTNYLTSKNTIVCFKNPYVTVEHFLLGWNMSGTHIILSKHGEKTFLTNNELFEFYDIVLDHQKVLKKIL